MIDKKIFSERLRMLRKERGLTQKQLGEAFNSPKQTTNSWENCASLPNLDTASDIAELFDVSLDYLCGRSESRERLP